MTTKTFAAAAFALLLAACSGSAAKSEGGNLRISAAAAIASGADFTSVTVSADPAGISASLAFDEANAQFVGSVSMPAGWQNLTVQGFGPDADLDGNPDLVAVGYATLLVEEGQQAAVLVRMMDVTPAPAVPDHAPIISVFEVANTNPAAGEAVALRVDATDIDGDAVSYLWQSNCSFGNGSAIADPAAAQTSFVAEAAGPCTITVTASANGKADSAQASLQVGGNGTLELVTMYVQKPVVLGISLSGMDVPFGCSVDRFGDEASCADAAAIGSRVQLFVSLDTASNGLSDLQVSSSCGGDIVITGGDLGWAFVDWTTPVTPGVCTLTAILTRDGYYDQLPVALLLQ